MTFLMTSVALDVAQVLGRFILFRYLSGINPSGWMASLTTVLVFLGGLGLRLISRGREAVGFSLVFVLGGLILGLLVGVFLVFFGRRAMVFWVPGIDIFNVEERL